MELSGVTLLRRLARMLGWPKPLCGENNHTFRPKKLQSNLTPHSAVFNIQRGYNMIKPHNQPNFEEKYQIHLQQRLKLNGM